MILGIYLLMYLKIYLFCICYVIGIREDIEGIRENIEGFVLLVCFLEFSKGG